MPIASRLLVRTLIDSGDRTVTVVIRRRSRSHPASADRQIRSSAKTEPARAVVVPGAPVLPESGFSRPVVRALVELGGRAHPIGREGVALDGRPAALARVVAEANRSLSARGRLPIPYPGVRSKERGR